MERDKTDQVFNAITSNGCREMDEERFHQAVNEVIELEINRLKEENKKLLLKYHEYLIGEGMNLDIALNKIYVDEFLSQNKH